MNTWPLKPVCWDWPTHLYERRTDRTWILWRRMINYDLFNLNKISYKTKRTDSSFNVSRSSMMSTSSCYDDDIEKCAFDLNILVIWLITYLFTISVNNGHHKFFVLNWWVELFDQIVIEWENLRTLNWILWFTRLVHQLLLF